MFSGVGFSQANDTDDSPSLGEDHQVQPAGEIADGLIAGLGIRAAGINLDHGPFKFELLGENKIDAVLGAVYLVFRRIEFEPHNLIVPPIKYAVQSRIVTAGRHEGSFKAWALRPRPVGPP